MAKIEKGNYSIEYDVRRSQKATKARIDVGLDTVRVVLPEESSLDPERFLENNIEWVLDKKEEYDSFKQKIPVREFQEGNKIPFLGKERNIEIKNQNKHEITENSIRIAERYIGDKDLKEKVKEVLRKEAKDLIKEKVKKFSQKAGSEYNKVYVRDQKTKWGSCSSKDNLSFNWRVSLGPEKVVNYVIAHEIAHLENKKHNEKFWKKVKEIYPDYRKGYEWLENKSHKLVYSKEEYLEKN